jgi:DNA-directed RNA polymerase specialized sigma24 family protein
MKDTYGIDRQFNREVDILESQLAEGLKKIAWAFALAPEGEINAPILSKELGYPAGTIRQYLKRAKDTIRTEMKKRGHDL